MSVELKKEMVSKINKKKHKIEGLNPILEKKVDELVEIKKKELKRMKMASKLRKICGDEYVFILFDADTAPKVGDSMQVYDMIATWKKAKNPVINRKNLM